jgi:uncharacterized peroxidase-related enzyme
VALIRTIGVDEAEGDVRAMYEQEAQSGYVANYVKVFSHRPPVMAAWNTLIGAIRSTVDLRRYELVTLAAARALHSSYCMLAHGKILRDQFFTPAQLAHIAGDTATAPLEPAEIAMMAYVDKLVRDASTIDAADIQTLRDHGFADAEIFDIAAVASARCFYSTLLDALGAEPEATFAELESELQTALTVGRPISTTPPERVSVDQASRRVNSNVAAGSAAEARPPITHT